MSVTDGVIGRRIVDTVTGRAPDSSCCPSEIARELGGDGWRDLMPRVRGVAITLAKQGAIEIRQRGQRVDPDDFSGPIRLARPRD